MKQFCRDDVTKNLFQCSFNFYSCLCYLQLNPDGGNKANIIHPKPQRRLWEVQSQFLPLRLSVSQFMSCGRLCQLPLAAGEFEQARPLDEKTDGWSGARTHEATEEDLQHIHTVSALAHAEWLQGENQKAPSLHIPPTPVHLTNGIRPTNQTILNFGSAIHRELSGRST